jgi:hypothetical protein
MPWIPLTVADVKTRLAGAELTALQSAALAAGQPDPTDDIVSKVIKECRGRLRNKTRLEEGDTIPDNWAHHCLAIIRYRLYTRLPLAQFLTPPRQREYDDAIDALKQLGPILPEEPAVPETTPVVSASSPHITPRTLYFTREAQSGL